MLEKLPKTGKILLLLIVKSLLLFVKFPELLTVGKPLEASLEECLANKDSFFVSLLLLFDFHHFDLNKPIEC